MIEQKMNKLKTMKPQFIKHIKLVNRLKCFTIFVFLLFGAFQSFSQTNDDCLMCHDDPELSKIRAGRKVSLYVKPDALKNSVHGDLECTFCHAEAAVSEFPHPENPPASDARLCLQFQPALPAWH